MQSNHDYIYTPEWNKTNTISFFQTNLWIYHLSESCPEFGSSGSGIVRAWSQRNDKKAYTIDENELILGAPGFFAFVPIDQRPVVTYQYSFVGPLSMQKGCDNAFHMYTRKIDSARQDKPHPNNGISFETNKLSYRGMYVHCTISYGNVDLPIQCVCAMCMSKDIVQNQYFRWKSVSCYWCSLLHALDC